MKMRLRRRRRGMSLVEVMVVIAIVLTLMSVLALGVYQIYAQSKQSTTRLVMGKVSQQIAVYALRVGGPPSTAEGLAKAYGTTRVPVDAWGHAFVYLSPGNDGEPYSLVSLGADGAPGGEETDEDLSWTEQVAR